MNWTESDFQALASAANAAFRRGDSRDAHVLDRLARMANAHLAHASADKLGSPWPMARITWRKVPSTLRDERLAGERAE